VIAGLCAPPGTMALNLPSAPPGGSSEELFRRNADPGIGDRELNRVCQVAGLERGRGMGRMRINPMQNLTSCDSLCRVAPVFEGVPVALLHEIGHRQHRLVAIADKMQSGDVDPEPLEKFLAAIKTA
jgi:hypothetical protein